MSHLLTDCGLPGIRTIPYGVHMCHFYERREDLAAPEDVKMGTYPIFRANRGKSHGQP